MLTSKVPDFLISSFILDAYENKYLKLYRVFRFNLLFVRDAVMIMKKLMMCVGIRVLETCGVLL